MATDYGLDLQALTDLPDPEVLVSGDLNVAYAEARRVLTGTGALEEIGDLEPYDCFNLREQLGLRPLPSDLDLLSTDASQVLAEDPRVLSIDAAVTYAAGTLSLTAQGQGTAGPFSLVLAVSAATSTLLAP